MRMFFILMVALVFNACSTIKVGERASLQDSLGVFRVDNPNSGSYATAFVIGTGPSGSLLLTNDHVCQNHEDLMSGFLYIEKEGQETPTIGRVINSDPVSDLCIFTVPTVYSTYYKLAFDEPSVGKMVYTIGHPGGSEEPRRTNILYFSREVYRLVAPPQRCGIADPRSRACVATIPVGILRGLVIGGQSGSPVINAEGNVIGIISRSDRRKTGYFIPSTLIMEFLQQSLQ